MSPLSAMEGKPELGSQPRTTAKMNIRFRPSQKVGTAAANMAPPEKTWSSALLYLMAETIPMGMPKARIRAMERLASHRLVSAPEAMTLVTGS